MNTVLGGLRVVDLTSGPVGGMATMVLADFGADVVKVEPPAGDRFRSLAASALWLRGKRSVVLDLHSIAGLGDLQSLVRTADVLVVSGPPGRAARWGVDAEAAEALQPSIVHCSITGWGGSGPLAGMPGYDALIAARGGRMVAFERQLRRGGPVFSAVPVVSHAAAFGAVQGITAGLIAAHRTGRPQRVETSLLQGLLPYDLIELLLVEVAARTGVVGAGLSSTGGDMPTLNYHPIMAADGRWIQCGNLLEHLFMSFLEALGLLGDMLADDRFIESPALWSPDAIEAARDLILTRALEKTADEWMQIFRDNGNVAAETYLDSADALQHLDLVGNGDRVVIDDPVLGRVLTVGPIAQLSETPPLVSRPAPRVGEHTREVLAETRAVAAPLAAAAPRQPAGQPLAGLVVVEFATIIAAPLSTAFLADLGARVIRVEVTDGDPYRHLVPGGSPAVKTTAGKESICLDLKSAAGRRIARQLVARADALVHNYRPGVAERLGIGFDDLHAAHPDLVWVAINGYGPNAPGTRRPATHPCAGAAMGGAGYQSGVALTTPCETLDDIREVARQLMRANEANPDPNTSVVAAAATLLGLLARERHGVGQAVYVNMLVANAYANADDFLLYDAKPPRLAVDADLLGLHRWYRLYRALEGWVFLAAPTLSEQARFWQAAGHPEGDLATVLATRTADKWEQVMVAAGVGCVRADGVSPGGFFSGHSQVLDNGLAPVAEHARFGTYRRWGPLVTVGGLAAHYGPGVLAGEHTDRLLAELGYDGSAVAELYRVGAVASETLG